MINAIIKGIFWVITKLFSLIMTPVIAVITTMFPDLSTAFSFIFTYLGYGFTYVRSILDLLLIPNSAIIFLFDYFIVTNTIFYSILAVRFAIKIYNKFKI